MRMLYFVALCVLFAIPAFAQQETLLSGNIEHSGGYGGPVIKTTQIGPNQDNGILVGGQGGWIINHTFVIGGGGYGLANEINPRWENSFMPIDPLSDYRMDFGYGGVYLGYVRNSERLIHYELHSIIGWGGVSYNYYQDDEDEDWNSEGDAFFIVEPGVNVELNVTEFFRIAVGGTYRLVTGVDYHDLTDNNLSGLSAQVVFKFGAF